MSTLYVCATPIGNLADVTQRLRETLAGVTVIACEDTRRTRALLSALKIPAPRLVSYHAPREREGSRTVVGLLDAGQDVALVCDAGTPVLSDPGSLLVMQAREAGHTVVPIVGPSSIAAAVSATGMGGGGFCFVGFFPRSGAELTRLFIEHSATVLIGMESPQRTAATLRAAAAFDPDRRCGVCRELSKRHEEIVVGSTGQLAVRDDWRGEVVLVFDSRVAEPTTLGPRSIELVAELVDAGLGLKQAAGIVARHDEVSQRGLYQAALAQRR